MARKVLIVEDESNIAELINLYLKKEGYETMIAEDGGKALELYRLFRPDLVLLDIMLPVMDGWAVCAKIRETDKTPIIMLTAKGETTDKVTGLEMGADDYIVKPFEMKELLARVHAVLRRLGRGRGQGPLPLLRRPGDQPGLLRTGGPGQAGGHPPEGDWSCFTTWPPPPTGCSPGTSCWTRCGALTTSATPAPWTCTSSACGKSWKGVSDQWSLKTVWGVGYKFEFHND